MTERIAELDGAIARVTRLLSAEEDDDKAAALVDERRAMRVEREGLVRQAAGVPSLDAARAKRGR